MQIDFEWFNVCVFFHINRRKCAAYVNSKTGHAQHKRCSLNQINQHIEHIHTRTFLQGTLTHVPEDLLIDDDLFPKKWERKEEKRKKYIGFGGFCDSMQFVCRTPLKSHLILLCGYVNTALNSTQRNRTKRNETKSKKKGLPSFGLACWRRKKEKREGEERKPICETLFCAKKQQNIFGNKAQPKELKSWEKFARGILN